MPSGENSTSKRSIDERIDALTMNLEILTHDVKSLRLTSAELLATSKQDAENIRPLVRIAEIHERRLTAVEGDQLPSSS